MCRRQLAADLELELLSGDVAAADPEAERWRLFDTTAQALSHAPRGLVVVLDDVHAADDSSLALLVHLARHLSRRPAKLLLFATYRSTEHEVLGEHLAEVAREPAVEHLALAGLDLAAVGTWLAAVAGPVDRAGEIHAATGGNAFLVGELAREPPAQGPLVAPATVRGAIRRRIAGLSAPAGPVLDAAAILGPEFTVGVVAAIVGRPALACLDVLGEAEHAGLVEPAGSPGRYRFVHGLVPAAVEADLRSRGPQRAAPRRGRSDRALLRPRPRAAAGSAGPPLGDRGRGRRGRPHGRHLGAQGRRRGVAPHRLGGGRAPVPAGPGGGRRRARRRGARRACSARWPPRTWLRAGWTTPRRPAATRRTPRAASGGPT